jgi:hypothetical protein
MRWRRSFSEEPSEEPSVKEGTGTTCKVIPLRTQWNIWAYQLDSLPSGACD